jgi:hypothetical protein
MINKIKQTIKKMKQGIFKPKPYIDLRLYNNSHKKGFRLVKIPISNIRLTIFILLVVLCIVTPFTNFLIPLIYKGVFK